MIPSVAFASLHSSLGIAQPSESAAASSVAKRSAPPQEQRLRKAAAEFESIVISSFWKSMMETFSSDDDSGDPGHSTFQDMGIQAMSQAMGKAGGLGLSQMLVNQLEQKLAKSNQSPGQSP